MRGMQEIVIPETPGLKPGRRSTEPLRQQLAHFHHEGIFQLSLARMNRMSDASIERFYAEYNQRKAAERLTRQCPIVLGSTSISFTRSSGLPPPFATLEIIRIGRNQASGIDQPGRRGGWPSGQTREWQRETKTGSAEKRTHSNHPRISPYH